MMRYNNSYNNIYEEYALSITSYYVKVLKTVKTRKSKNESGREIPLRKP